MIKSTSLTLIVATGAALAAAPEEYTLTDISAWTAGQLATLPHFDRYVPLTPPGASIDFTAVCANGLGLTAGIRDIADNADRQGAFVTSAGQTDVPPWGTYHWSYWIYDGHDNHHYWGSVAHSPVRAANVLGQVVGYANLAGGGSGVGSTSEFDDHAYLWDPAIGGKLDLTPTAHRADPRDLNDRGEITGSWSDDTASHPFRRAADGSFTDFVFDEPFSHYIAPAVINNHGHVAGMITIWKTPRIYHPFVSESGSAVVTLPYPPQASPDTGSIADINDHDVIIGEAHKAASSIETSAVRWTRDGSTWVAEDLNELVEFADGQPEVILDRSIAINDAGHIIASGHLDGTDTWNTHRFLLTPDLFAPPAVTTLPPAAVTSTGATLRAKINPGNLVTTSSFQHGTTDGYGTNTPLASSAGTLPVLAGLPITGLSPRTIYHFRATANNASGSTDGDDASFTTAWDWPSWGAAVLGSTAPDADTNGNGLADLIDYASGNAPPPTGTLAADQLQFTFRRSLIADGVTLVVQVSDDLLTWNDGSSYSISGSNPDNTFTTELSRTADGPDGEWITVAADATLPARFIRLMASLP